MAYTYTCTSCGVDAQTTRAADLRNRSGRRCQGCKSVQDRPPSGVASGTSGAHIAVSEALS